MTRLPAKRRGKFFLDSYGRYTPKLDPQLFNAATGRAQPHRGIDRASGRPREAPAVKNQRGARSNSHLRWGMEHQTP